MDNSPKALDRFCDLNAWQTAAIQDGLDDLQQNRIVDHDTLKSHWKILPGHKNPVY
jgi:predicted transcriptional regulator